MIISSGLAARNTKGEIMRVTHLAGMLIAVVAFGTSAVAQESSTLEKIKDSGVVSLGHRESSIPFSYYDDQQQVVGYSQARRTTASRS
jgi:glutamate/aspartate transport system substrate-binding protein